MKTLLFLLSLVCAIASQAGLLPASSFLVSVALLGFIALLAGYNVVAR